MLRCISAGTPAKDDDTEASDRALLFAFHSEQDELEATLSGPSTVNDTQVDIYGISADGQQQPYLGGVKFNVGDFIKVGDGNPVKITAIDISGNPPLGPVTVESSIEGTATHPIGTTCTIFRQNRNALSDSEDGICVVRNGGSFTAGTLANLDLQYTERVRPGMVLFGANPFYVQVRSVEQIPAASWHVKFTRARVMPGVISFDLNDAQTGTTFYLDGDRLGAAIWVQTQGRSFAIADTGVSFGIISKDSATDEEGRFEVGDRVSIQTYGEELSEVKGASYTQILQESIARYGVKEWKPRVRNRLITIQRVSTMLDALGPWKYPQFQSQVPRAPLLLSITVDGHIRIRDSHLFPTSTLGLRHAIQSMSWQLDTGTMTLKARTFQTNLDGYDDEDRDAVPAGPTAPGIGVDRGDRSTRGRGR